MARSGTHRVSIGGLGVGLSTRGYDQDFFEQLLHILEFRIHILVDDLSWPPKFVECLHEPPLSERCSSTVK